MRNVCLATFMLVFAALFGPCAAYAEDTETDSSKSVLDKINQQVEDEDAHLKELTGKQEKLGADLRESQNQLDKLRKEESSLTKERDGIQKQKDELDASVKQGEAKIESVRSLFRKRIRALYMGRTYDLAENLLGVHDSSELARNAYFLSKMSSYDQKLVQNLVSLNEAQAKKKVELEKIIQQRDLVIGKLTTQRKTIEDKNAEKARIFNELKLQKSRVEESLAALRAQALRLETVVASLTGAEEKPSKTASEKTEPILKAGVAPTERFSGDGLAKKKGELALPITGKVVQGFGKHQVSEFSDMVFSKGVEFSAAPGAAVSAVEKGRVLFTGRMPGYGTIIILDHGERYYSLYGRLGAVKVAPGSVVEKGALLAEASEPDERGRNFYFEIRQNGNPVSPSGFYKVKLEP